MAISEKKRTDLYQEMKQFHLEEKDLKERFISGSGKGGQTINKRKHCVYLKHLPTGIEIKCQKGRYREENRFFARRALLEKIKEKQGAFQSAHQQKVLKIRKQKKRRKRRCTRSQNPFTT